MKINEILTEKDTDIYVDHFKTLRDVDFENELDEWDIVMKNKYTPFQFLAFLKATDSLGYDKSFDDISMISTLESNIKELSSLVDYTLDNYNTHNNHSINRGKGEKEFGERSTKLLDSIFGTIGECEMLHKYFNEKIIN